jgi:hypothetical protein
MMELRNTHPRRTLNYRLERIFAGHPQPGWSTGTIAPGAAALRLGCSLVDGHPQGWVVRRVRFE